MALVVDRTLNSKETNKLFYNCYFSMTVNETSVDFDKILSLEMPFAVVETPFFIISDHPLMSALATAFQSWLTKFPSGYF